MLDLCAILDINWDKRYSVVQDKTGLAIIGSSVECSCVEPTIVEFADHNNSVLDNFFQIARIRYIRMIHRVIA